MKRLAWLLLLGCTDSDPTVVVYDGLDDEPGRMVVAQAQRELPFTVKRLGDTEATKTAGLVHRLRLEASFPQADVFVCGEPLSVAALAAEGVLLSEGEVLAGRVRGLVVHSDREHAQCPSSWLDLASDRWRDQGLAVADPRYGSTGAHLGVLRSVLGETEYRFLLRGLNEVGVRLVAGGNRAVVDEVAQGEVAFGATDADDVAAAQALGQPVRFLPLPLDQVRGPWIMTAEARLVVPSTPEGVMYLEWMRKNGAKVFRSAAPGWLHPDQLPEGLRYQPDRASEEQSVAVEEALQIFGAS
ncbi:MAG: substrate-binding domain-containing protein [Planctomycetota bacterium]|nr:substrate-binding domain-containing protein [Planctomycetota bacterium]